jgi:replication-associated recombination protein RarA
VLTEKYKPLRVSEFVGLDKPKKIIGKWLQSPQSQSFLFVGKPGTGKTAMAEAIARLVEAANKLPSRSCGCRNCVQAYHDFYAALAPFTQPEGKGK